RRELARRAPPELLELLEVRDARAFGPLDEEPDESREDVVVIVATIGAALIAVPPRLEEVSVRLLVGTVTVLVLVSEAEVDEPPRDRVVAQRERRRIALGDHAAQFGA